MVGRLRLWSLLVALLCHSSLLMGQVVPGTGTRVATDDFEDPEWEYIHRNPKSSEEQDGRTRLPGGYSTNQLWNESSLRGHPDIIRRVTTPEGGIAGSVGALLIGTRHSGIPNRPSGKNEQDDLIMNIRSQWGGSYPASWSPNVVVRVFVPPPEEWEPRNGTSFGFRTSVFGSRPKAPQRRGLFRTSGTEAEESWPGIFLLRQRGGGDTGDSIYFIIRGRENGDFRGPTLSQTGWWTLGISHTPDGRVHYYARAGVEDLTQADRIASHYPYNFRVQRLDGVFFDVFNRYDGRTMSTPWIIDDPAVYVVRR